MQAIIDDESIYKFCSILKSLIDPQQHNQPSTCYDLVKEPSISHQMYVERLVDYTMADENCLELSLQYMKKIGVVITKMNIHSMLAVCLLLAIKYDQDPPMCWTNRYFSEVCGIDLMRLNLLELETLRLLHYNLYIDQQQKRIFFDG